MENGYTDTDQVLDLVRRRPATELAGDVDAYGTLLTPDLVGVGPVGFVLSGPLIKSGQMPAFTR